MLLLQQMTFTKMLCSLLLVVTLFSACKKDIKTPTFQAPTFVEQQSMFYLSWIAECTADTAMVQDSLRGLQSLTTLGSTQLASAFTNPILTSTFGDYGATPVWGPALSVSVVGDSAVITDNLLYTARSEDEDNVTYIIAVAGTNAISAFDWFEEDFNVQNTLPWNDPSGQSHGSIAAGSALGLNTLLQLKDQHNENIINFITKALLNSNHSKKYTIAVTGHSLGGTLSPLLALYIKERLAALPLSVTYSVEAWPYAGPTPGDETFADYLVSTLDAYHAYYNNFDLVPHIWELDSLERLCKLYTVDENKCGYTDANANIANGFVQWMISLSDSSSINYHIAGTPNTFNGNRLPLDANYCEILAVLADSITTGEQDLYKDLKFVLEIIDLQCGDTNPTNNLKDNIAYLLLYLRDVDYQHTTAYELQYFRDSIIMANVDALFPAGTDELTYIDPVISELLLTVGNYISSRTNTDCACQS